MHTYRIGPNTLRGATTVVVLFLSTAASAQDLSYSASDISDASICSWGYDEEGTDSKTGEHIVDWSIKASDVLLQLPNSLDLGTINLDPNKRPDVSSPYLSHWLERKRVEHLVFFYLQRKEASDEIMFGDLLDEEAHSWLHGILSLEEFRYGGETSEGSTTELEPRYAFAVNAVADSIRAEKEKIIKNFTFESSGFKHIDDQARDIFYLIAQGVELQLAAATTPLIMYDVGPVIERLQEAEKEIVKLKQEIERISDQHKLVRMENTILVTSTIANLPLDLLGGGLAISPVVASVGRVAKCSCSGLMRVAKVAPSFIRGAAAQLTFHNIGMMGHAGLRLGGMSARLAARTLAGGGRLSLDAAKWFVKGLRNYTFPKTVNALYHTTSDEAVTSILNGIEGSSTFTSGVMRPGNYEYGIYTLATPANQGSRLLSYVTTGSTKAFNGNAVIVFKGEALKAFKRMPHLGLGAAKKRFGGEFISRSHYIKILKHEAPVVQDGITTLVVSEAESFGTASARATAAHYAARFAHEWPGLAVGMPAAGLGMGAYSLTIYGKDQLEETWNSSTEKTTHDDVEDDK